MDFANMTYSELAKLDRAIGWELLKRHWYIYVLVVVAYLIFMYFMYRSKTRGSDIFKKKRWKNDI